MILIWQRPDLENLSVVDVHGKTVSEVFDELTSIIEVLQIPAELVKVRNYEVGITWKHLLDGFGVAIGTGRDEMIPRHKWIACFPVTGGSEGHYIHIDLISFDGNGNQTTKPLFVAKTFEGWDVAAVFAALCGRILLA
ncbi:hypothetical protein H6G00_01820 [Leptolyngbya sp. FACHB-541]|uniref:hypothetical protein n=1 Tax=Leptolyngbya sp. FACHB-541 TaxID=2692810 RepID=UPI001687FEEE|nr:hypothetical protein [Leptolyngbya sp. FACHB-541]MBD1995369.1 hypothetical protein [Leptolyngbya sp. FACHB-541]